MAPVRAIVVDDHRILADALAMLLGRHPEIDVVGCAYNGGDALDLFDETKPSVAVIDVAMPGLDGFATAEELLRRAPDLAIVMVTGDDDASHRRRALEVGAASFLTKSQAVSKLIDEVLELRRSGRLA